MIKSIAKMPEVLIGKIVFQGTPEQAKNYFNGIVINSALKNAHSSAINR